MGALSQRRTFGKRAWYVQGNRREAFGWIEAVSVCFKAGFISKGVAEGMLRAKVTEEDFEDYKRARGEPLQ